MFPRVDRYMPEFISLMAKRRKWSSLPPATKRHMVGELLFSFVEAAMVTCVNLDKMTAAGSFTSFQYSIHYLAFNPLCFNRPEKP
jgi:hypothetical protein